MSNSTSAVLGTVIGAIDVILSVSLQLQQIGAVIQKAQDEGRDLDDDEIAEITKNKAAAFSRLRAALSE